MHTLLLTYVCIALQGWGLRESGALVAVHSHQGHTVALPGTLQLRP